MWAGVGDLVSGGKKVGGVVVSPIAEGVGDRVVVGKDVGGGGLTVGGGGKIGSVAVGAGMMGSGVTVGVGLGKAGFAPLQKRLVPRTTRTAPATNESSARAVDHRRDGCFPIQAERRLGTRTTTPAPIRINPSRIQRQGALKSVALMLAIDDMAGVGVRVGVGIGVADGTVSALDGLGVAVGVEERGGSPGSGVGLSVAGTDIGEVGLAGCPVDSVAATEGSVATAVGLPAGWPVPVGVGEGDDGAGGMGVSTGPDGGRVGPAVGGTTDGPAVGGVTGGVVGVGVGMVWFRRLAWTPAGPQANSRMTSMPSRAKTTTRLGASFSVMGLPSFRGIRLQTHDRCAGRYPIPADRPAWQIPARHLGAE